MVTNAATAPHVATLLPSRDWLGANSAAELTACEFLRAFKVGQISAAEYVQAFIDRIEQYDTSIQCWKVTDPDSALLRAKAIDDARTRGEPIKQVSGVPLAVKDIFNTYDFPTSMGSPIMDGYTPGNDARVVSNFRLEDGIVLGKTVTAEFAVHQPGPTINPHNPERTPGTSSSGSAVAIATRMAPLALASQTAGSIIRPASYCGVFGFKPSFGLIPRTAMLKTTDTLDTVGFMARSTEDLALMFETTRVRGHNYPVSEAGLALPTNRNMTGTNWRVGVLRHAIRDHESSATRAAFESVVDNLANAGCEIIDVHLPSEFDETWQVHEHIYCRALAYYFKIEWDGAPDLFSPAMQEMIRQGLEVSPETYLQDIERQRVISTLFNKISSEWDVLIVPATADEAPAAQSLDDLPDSCLVWTTVGAPVLGIPGLRGRTSLPVGIQIVGRRFSDYRVLEFGTFAQQLLHSS